MTILGKPIRLLPHRAFSAIRGTGDRSRTVLLELLLLMMVTSFLTACQSTSPQTVGSLSSVPEDSLSTDSMRLREGDAIRITFENATNLSTIQTIPLDGFITLPLIEPIKAAGMTLLDLEATLTVLYEPQIKTSEIRVTRVASSASYSVGGAVLKPGKFALDRPLTALEAVIEAGGVDHARAKLSEVVVLRIENNRRVKYRVNLKRALRGKEIDLFYLKPFDIIFVPQKTFNF
jgi:polysaccharide export outer membrane protein